MSTEAMKLALAAIEDLRGYRPDIDTAIETLRTALSQQPVTAIECGITGMAKTTCPFCEQSFAFEHEQPSTSEPVWFHKHWGDDDDIFYRPDDNIPSGSTPLYTRQAPSVPDEKPLPDLMMASYHEAIGWNACRAAMLAAKDAL